MENKIETAETAIDSNEGHLDSPSASQNNSWKKLSKSSIIFRVSIVLFLLYTFILSLDFMALAFKILATKRAGQIFVQGHLVNNPIAGLVAGCIVTVLLQSSSTTTSLIITMVASEILSVKTAVPIIMGANIGTSLTSTIIAIGQIDDAEIYERAFAAATMHDMFNVLSVVVILPLESITQFLSRLSEIIAKQLHDIRSHDVELKILSRLTNPIISQIILVNRTFIEQISTSGIINKNERVLQIYAESWSDWVGFVNKSSNSTLNMSDFAPRETCYAIFCHWPHSDKWAGVLLLAISFVTILPSLFLMVHFLSSIFAGKINGVVNKFLNLGFPGMFSRLDFLIGYVAIVIGALMTVMVQSSSIFTCALTPLVGLNIVSIERAFPMTLGANIGTTVTGFLVSLASDQNFEQALLISLCHLLFNLIGVFIWYPVPILRKIPLRAAKRLGKTARRYRWFSFAYILFLFIFLPGIIFALSLTGFLYLETFCISSSLLIFSVLILQLMQRFTPQILHEKLQNFNFLPEFLRSLEPYDSAGQNIVKKMQITCQKNFEKYQIGLFC